MLLHLPLRLVQQHRVRLVRKLRRTLRSRTRHHLCTLGVSRSGGLGCCVVCGARARHWLGKRRGCHRFRLHADDLFGLNLDNPHSPRRKQHQRAERGDTCGQGSEHQC